MPKFFLSDEHFGEEYVTFNGRNARHVAYSLRMAKGDGITLCDMSGNKYECVIESFISFTYARTAAACPSGTPTSHESVYISTNPHLGLQKMC